MTKSWGMIDNRTISAITPVDESTSDVRFMVYIGRTPGKDTPRAEAKASEFGEEVIRQFSQDIHIWSHQRYSDPPALSHVASTRASPRSASGPSSSIPTARGGSAAELQAADSSEGLTSMIHPLHRSGSSRSPPATSAPR